MNLTTKKLVTISLLVALSVILSIVDSFIPGFVPGMKLGLANIIILFALYNLGFLETLMINLLRVLLASLLRGNFLSMGFVMSLSGAIASLLIMVLVKKYIAKLHIVGVSVLGSLFHSMAQIGVAILYLGTSKALYYLPILSLTSIITGIFIGISVIYLNKLNLLKNIDVNKND